MTPKRPRDPNQLGKADTIYGFDTEDAVLDWIKEKSGAWVRDQKLSHQQFTIGSFSKLTHYPAPSVHQTQDLMD